MNQIKIQLLENEIATNQIVIDVDDINALSSKYGLDVIKLSINALIHDYGYYIYVPIKDKKVKFKYRQHNTERLEVTIYKFENQEDWAQLCDYFIQWNQDTKQFAKVHYCRNFYADSFFGKVELVGGIPIDIVGLTEPQSFNIVFDCYVKT